MASLTGLAKSPIPSHRVLFIVSHIIFTQCGENLDVHPCPARRKDKLHLVRSGFCPEYSRSSHPRTSINFPPVHLHHRASNLASHSQCYSCLTQAIGNHVEGQSFPPNPHASPWSWLSIRQICSWIDEINEREESCIEKYYSVPSYPVSYVRVHDQDQPRER